MNDKFKSSLITLFMLAVVLIVSFIVVHVLNQSQVKPAEPRVAEQYRLPVPPCSGFGLRAPR